MTHKFWQRAFSTLLLLGWIVGLVQPASVSAAPLPQKEQPLASTFEPSVVVPDKSDLSPALISITPQPTTPAEGKEIPNFVLPKVAKALGSTGDLSIVQSSPGGPNAMPAPVLNFEGVNNIDFVYPPDTEGDIGPNHYVQWVNLSFEIWLIDKVNHTATSVYGPAAGNTLWTGFSGPCQTTNDGDPIALYDPLANRWLMSQFALPNYPNGPFYQCVAVSQTPDPTGAWYRYQYTWPGNKMNDYPKFGVWPDAYYMTANQFASGTGSWAGAGVAALNRAKLLAGDPTAEMVYFDLFGVNSNFGGMLPADFDGLTSSLPPQGAPGLFSEWDDSTFLGDPTDTIRIWEFHVDWTTPANSTFGVGGLPNTLFPTADVDPNMCNYSRSCIPQPGTSQGLDAISDRLMYRLQYRNFGGYQTLVSNHTVDVGGDHAGVHWFELRKPGANPWAMYQEGVYAPDADHRWMGSAALDHVGDLALGYSVSSSTVYPSVRYAGRLAGDPLGTLPQAEVQLIAGTGSQTGTGARWGDYSMMGVDPTDDCTFWYTQEYIQTTGTAPWRTRIGAFKFPNCSVGPHGTLAGSVQSSTSTPIVGATVTASSTPTQTYTTLSGTGGAYNLQLPVDVYTATASAYGYQPQTFTGVQIISGTTTTQDFTLAPAATVTVQGTVTDANTGWPLYAKITIQGYPGDHIWNNPVTGHYSIDLAAGAVYTFTAAAWVPGYLPEIVAVGPLSGPTTQDFALDVNTATCNAPGYVLQASTMLTENFDAVTPPTLPAGWAVVDVNGTQGNWATNASTVHPSGGGTHSAPNLVYFNSWTATTGNNTRLYRTNGINMSSVPGAQVGLWMYHDTGYSSSNDRVQVQVSTDAGSTWQSVGAAISRYDGSTSWKQHIVDISAYTGAGMTDVRLGFLGVSEYGNDVHVDDVAVNATECLPQPGGLVVGNTYDANTDAPLVGAAVTNDSGGSTTTAANPDDLAQAPAFYTLFSPAQQHVFTATLGGGYGSDIKLVTVVGNSTVGQDFHLPAGKLTYVPPALTATLQLGASTTKGLTLTNEGGLPVNWELVELDKGMVPVGRIETPDWVVKPFRQNWASTQGMNLPPQPTAAPFAAGDIIQSWNAGGFRWGVTFDSVDGTVWLSSPAASWGGDDHLYEYQTNGTLTGRVWPQSLPHSSGPADMAFNWTTGMMWIMNVNTGVANCIYEIDPATGYTGNSICPGGGTGFSISQRGLAYDPSTDTWYAGGWNDFMVYHFASDGTILEAVNTGLDISGLAYNPDTHHLFVMTNASPNNLYVLDAANNFTIVGQFTIAGFSSYGGAGLEFDCQGNLWAMDQYTNIAYQVQSGETANLCGRDVPWLSESPITGTIPGGAMSAMQPIVNIPTGLAPSSPEAQDNVGAETSTTTGEPSAIGLASYPYIPTSVLYSNGPLVTHPGGGAGGADASALQTALGMNTYGFGHQISAGFRIADDFIVPGSGWQVNKITFFAYQTGSGTTSTINNVNLRIWNGVPDAPGSSVVWGDTTTNRLTNTTWSNIYRVQDTTLTNNARPVMADTVTVGTFLPPGTYWLDWQTGGTLASGPWAPPITILGQTTTGNALQYTGSWAAVVDSGSLTPQGFPFIIEGPTSQRVDVTFDAGAVSQPGEYHAQLKIKNNTPYVVPNVPVTMTVTAPETWGKLEGTVTGLGYCDLNPAPIKDAQVVIEPSVGQPITLTTDVNGHYVFWLDQALSPLIVSASAPDHTFGMASGVVIVGGQTTTQNFDLRWLRPCVGVNPSSLSVTVTQGFTLTVPLRVSDTGAASLNYEFLEIPGTPFPRIVTKLAGPSVPEARVAPSVAGETASIYTARPEDILINEGFEGGVVPPIGWTQVINNPYTWSIATSSPHSGSYNAHVLYDFNQNEWLVSPELNLREGTLSLWSFGSLYWCKGQPYDNCDLNIWIVVGNVGGGDDIFVGKADDAWTANWTWAQSVFNLTPLLPGGPVRIGFQYQGNDGAEIALDDIVLDGMVGSDVIWLTENPVSGTLGADSFINDQITFTAFPTMTVGNTYTATLRLKSNDPVKDTLNIPVAMTVVAPVYGVAISGNMSQTALPGSVVTYTVLVTNTSNGPSDTYNLTLGAHTWTTTLDKATVGPLAKSASAQVKVTVHIPAGAAGGAFDAVQVTATSQHDATKHAATTLTTHATTVYGVTLTPATAAKSGAQGATIDYTLHITNTGNVANTFTFAASGNAWVVVVPSPVTLNAGASATVVVHVTIPSTADIGDSDTVTITASGAGGASDSSVLTTTVNMMKIFMPIITKGFHS